MDRLKGKVALITGAARGLGAAIARRMHEEGASVVVNDLNLEAAQRTAQPLQGMGLAADVSDSAAVDRMFEQVRQQFGRLDILVNNAGISGMESDEQLQQRMSTMAAAAEAGETVHNDHTVNVSDEQWQQMLAVHLNGTFYCTRAALRLMNEANHGCIINMGSIMGTAGGGGSAAYCAAKAAIMGFTRSVAREVVSRNIRVNSIAPGFIDTDMTAPMGPYRAVLEAQTPMGRFGEPDDIAWAAVYLASDEAKFVTGQVLSPNGGWHMSQ